MNKFFAISLFILMWVAILIPTWIAIGIYNIADPVGFWQQFAFWAVAVFILGSVQLVTLIYGGIGSIAICLNIWSSNNSIINFGKSNKHG